MTETGLVEMESDVADGCTCAETNVGNQAARRSVKALMDFIL